MAHIHGLGIGSAAVSSLTGAGESKPAGRIDDTPAAQKGDQASLSAAAALAGQDGSDVRLDKVQALQKAIASGSYNVSASDVAGKLLDALAG